MKNLIIAVIGSGSTYTPELINGFIKRKDELPVKSFYLMDIDREKLDIVGDMAERMLAFSGIPCKVVKTQSLIEALKDADFVIAQIRVGKLDARIKDEKIPLKYGFIGQETTGIGGFMKAMRTIPALMNIADAMEKHCPDAWLINFSNPSGLIAEALLNYSQIKMLGLCNVPINLKKRAADWITESPSNLEFDYVGLNHLSWITGMYKNGAEILRDKLLETDENGNLKNMPEFGWDRDLAEKVGALPCGYLKYYYFKDKVFEELIREKNCRGEVCKEIEKELLAMYKDPMLKEKPAALDKRGGAMYSEAAVSLVSAIYNDKNEVHIVNVKNRNVLDFMAHDDVVEIACRVGKDGAAPVSPKGPVKDDIKNMMQLLKLYEKRAAQAGVTGDYNKALQALLVHPLAGGDYYRTKAALDEIFEAHKDFLPQFYDKKQ